METKECNLCHEEKSLSEFRKDKSIKSGYQGRCKVCASRQIKENYSRYKNKVTIRTMKYRHENRNKLLLYLQDKKCVHCSETNPVVFEFHHPDPSKKEFTIGQAHCANWNTLLKEIEKCVILCANCHRIEHWRLRQEIN